MSSKANITDQELMLRISRDDVAAFDRLFATYYPGLMRFAKSLMPYPSDAAEDIVCTVFGNLWEQRRDFIITGSLAAYLYTSVKNNTLKAKLKENRYSRTDTDLHVEPSESAYYEPDKLVQYKELQNRIGYLLEKLPPRTRLVFRLHREEKLTYDEIASLLNISVHSVKTHMYRALTFLKSALLPLGQ